MLLLRVVYAIRFLFLFEIIGGVQQLAKKR
jgi:hypothetical protein